LQRQHGREYSGKQCPPVKEVLEKIELIYQNANYTCPDVATKKKKENLL
jgi:hypothetical protein